MSVRKNVSPASPGTAPHSFFYCQVFLDQTFTPSVINWASIKFREFCKFLTRKVHAKRRINCPSKIIYPRNSISFQWKTAVLGNILSNLRDLGYSIKFTLSVLARSKSHCKNCLLSQLLTSFFSSQI